MRTNHVHSLALHRRHPYGISEDDMTQAALRVVEKETSMDKHKALEAAVAQIERVHGKGSVMRLGQRENAINADAISTGSLGLDMALGIGGLPRGRVIEIYGPEASGKTTLSGKAGSRPAKTGDAVGDGETLKTGPKASAIVEYPDGSRVKLRAESAFKFTVPGETAGLKGGLLSLGGVFARVAKGRPGHFRVNTPTAVASVRGTEFFTAYGRHGDEGRDLWVCVGKGAIDLSATGSPDAMVVKEGEGVLLPGGKRTTKAQRYEWTKSLNWTMDPGEGDTGDATDLDAAYADLRDQDYR